MAGALIICVFAATLVQRIEFHSMLVVMQNISLPRMLVQSTSSVTMKRAGGTTWWMWMATACWTSTLRSPPFQLVSSNDPNTDTCIVRVANMD